MLNLAMIGLLSFIIAGAKLEDLKGLYLLSSMEFSLVDVLSNLKFSLNK